LRVVCAIFACQIDTLLSSRLIETENSAFRILEANRPRDRSYDLYIYSIASMLYGILSSLRLVWTVRWHQLTCKVVKAYESLGQIKGGGFCL
jgi:hypothetical protein